MNNRLDRLERMIPIKPDNRIAQLNSLSGVLIVPHQQGAYVAISPGAWNILSTEDRKYIGALGINSHMNPDEI